MSRSHDHDHETGVYRGGRLRRLEEKQTKLLEALAGSDAERASQAREELARLESLHAIGRRAGGSP